MQSRKTVLAVLVTLVAVTVHAEAVRKRALLVGINDYSASALKPETSRDPADRTWPNLSGTINDVHLMRDLLGPMYGFKGEDIVILTDQQATRSSILRELKRLEKTARKDDVVLFYYSGHGSQVHNSLSPEKDKLDESIVPADSRLGVEDIRDKELRKIFNRILDAGAKLTAVLDTCHSGSGARAGLDAGLGTRGVKPDERDVADPSNPPHPEHRGALIMAATQDFDRAYEIPAPDGVTRGAFTWALACALKDAERGEPVSDTFLRITAHLGVSGPGQNPVLAGTAEVRLRPFLGERIDRKNRRPVIAIQEIRADGTYELQGGWANGVTTGSELRVVGDPSVQLEVQSITGISSSVARLVSAPPPRSGALLGTGTLLEIAAWAPPPTRPLRVCIPLAEDDAFAVARKLRDAATAHGISWITDPTESAATHFIRWRDGGWEVLADGATHSTTRPLDGIGAGSSVFVQLPVPAKVARLIAEVEGIEITETPEAADYILAGRLIADRVEYAFIRPQIAASEGTRAALPVRTAWAKAGSSFVLETALMRLERIHAWHELTSPAGPLSDYTLGIRRADDHVLIEDGVLVGERPHHLVLRPKPGVAESYTRYVYVFVIDSAGASTLLFPRADSGSVENRLPLTRRAAKAVRHAEAEIALDDSDPFIVYAPYGADTYFLLSTSEPLAALGALEWSSVRGGKWPESSEASPRTPLERLLTRTLSGSRGEPNERPLRVPTDWSLEKVTFYSVPPRRTLP
jgi:hypothetical protein